MSWTNFGRIGRVEFWQDKSPMKDIKTDGLDFKFRAERIVNSGFVQAQPQATVDILGLNPITISNICRFCGDADYYRRKISVCVYAGYENDPAGAQPLFHMPLWRATPSIPPENWLSLTVKPFYLSEAMKSYSFCPPVFSGIGQTGMKNDSALEKDKSKQKSLSVRELCDIVGNEFGFYFDWSKDQFAWDFAEKTRVYFFGCNGGRMEALDALRKKLPKLRFVLRPFSAGIIYDVYHILSDYPDRNMWTVDKDHGMIGLPRYVNGTRNNKIISVRTLLNPSIDAFDMIALKSDIARDLTGIYHVRTVSHYGHLRGHEWYTDLECDQVDPQRRKDAQDRLEAVQNDGS